MTSLASQLQRLSVPYTQSVWAPDKRRASLLFNPNEAANLDRQAVYAIGISGLEELEGLDDVFSEYTNSLFNLSSQSWERTLQSSDINQQLDETLQRFLVQLSPYFLLKCAHKALEWLIYRYHIHYMNINAVLQCIFPYHETKIFVRMVQLLPIEKQTHTWNWIHASGKTGAPLTQSAIINHSRSDPAFLTFVCDLVQTFIKTLGAANQNLRAVVGFWTCTVLGVTEERGYVTERIMSILVPALVRGLKSKCIDFKAASYMVVSQLASHTTLKSELVLSLMKVLTKYISPKLTKEALMCVALVCKTQKVEDLPRKHFKRICRIPALVPLLAVLANRYDIADLLRCFLYRLIPVAIDATTLGSLSSSSAGSDEEFGHSGPIQYDSLLGSLLSEITLETNMATELAKRLIKELVVAKESKQPDEKWKLSAQAYLSVIQTRYAVSFDLAVESLVGGATKEVSPTSLQAVLQAAVGGARGRLIDGSTSLMLAMNHSHGQTRALAVGHLAEVLQEQGLGIGQESNTEVGDMLLLRIADDDPTVVQAVLDIGDVLLKVVSKEKLSEALLQMLTQRQSQTNWSQVLRQAAQLLCSEGMIGVMPDLGLRLLPFLLVCETDPSQLALPLAILRSPVANQDGILKKFNKQWVTVSQKKIGKQKKLSMTLNAEIIKGCAAAFTASDKNDMLSAVCQRSLVDRHMCLLAMSALSEALQNPETEETITMDAASYLLQIVAAQIPHLEKVTDFKTDGTMAPYLTACVQALRDDDVIFPSVAIWWALKSLVAYIGEHKSTLSASRLSLEDPFVAIAVKTLDVLVTVSCNSDKKDTDMTPWHKIVRTLTQSILTISEFSRLAAVLWEMHISQESPQVSPVTQVAATHLVARAWLGANRDELVKLLESKTSPVLPSLLVCLGSCVETLRTGAILCIKAARKVDKDMGCCTKLFKKVFKQQEEISADAAHIQNILWKVLKEDADLCDLVTHAVIDNQTPPTVRERLLYNLQATPNKCVLAKLVPLGKEVLDLCVDGSVKSVHVVMLRHLVERIDVGDAKELRANSDVFIFLLRALQTTHKIKGLDLPPSIVMAQVTREFFSGLPSNTERKQIVSAIMDITEKPVNPDVINQGHRVLQQLRLEWDAVSHELLPEAAGPATPSTVKNRRRSRGAAVLSQPMLSWKRITFLLEALQQRKSMKDSEACVSALFTLLAKLQDHEGEEWEYRQLLVLSLLQNLTSRWQQQQHSPKQESVNVEVLVQVVRNPRASTQTKQHALTVMANLAFYFPEHLLDHVMSIFTFVGTGLLAADDEHSLKVVSRTITTIIPALLGARSNTEKDTDSLITQIVQVFVDAQRSIPRHRSMAVFETLVTALGTETALWRVLALLVSTATLHRDSEPASSQDEPSHSVTGTLEQDLEFGIKVCEQFELSTLVETATRVVQYLQWLVGQHDQTPSAPKGKGRRPRTRSESDVSPVLDISILSAHQLRLLQFHLTRLLTRLLSSEVLINQVLHGGDTDASIFQGFVQQSVTYLLAIARIQSPANTSQHKFWKAVMGKAYEVLDKVLYLLPTRILMEVILGLLNLDIPGIRRKALELLASKLQALLVSAPTEDQQKPPVDVVDILLNIAMEENNTGDADITATQQLALFNLKLLCKILGEENQSLFVKVMKTVTVQVTTDAPPAVVGSVLLVAAEVVSLVRAHAIPHLPKLVNPLLELLSNREFIIEHELVLTCGLTMLHRIVVTLPHFLSPYLRHILTVVCLLDSLSQSSDKKSQAALRLSAIRHQVATVIAPRVLVPALGETFADVLSSEQCSKMALTSVMSIAAEHVTSISRDDITSQHTPLLDVFCAALDLRNNNSELSGTVVSEVEGAVIDAMLAMVVRLSEATFRPMFYKIYDWGCREDTEETRLRKVTFFRLANSLAEKLRSLFNLFIGQMLQAACVILTANNSLSNAEPYFGSGPGATRLSCELVGYILDCLTKCMMHDTEGIFSGNIFNMLLQPLVDQMENFLGSDTDYEQRMQSHVIPCLSHFMVAAKEDTHQKALNYQILLKARHLSPKVRFTALRVISGAAAQMGDDYMVLLPETIPFLAELMEDECEEVERECQLVIAKLEDVLGESLQKYF